jgi:hypothetical protein
MRVERYCVTTMWVDADLAKEEDAWCRSPFHLPALPASGGMNLSHHTLELWV